MTLQLMMLSIFHVLIVYPPCRNVYSNFCPYVIELLVFYAYFITKWLVEAILLKYKEMEKYDMLGELLMLHCSYSVLLIRN